MIVGIDEVGRGCLAGPLVASAVLLTRPVSGLTDSKQLSRKQRQELARQIQGSAVIGVGWVWPQYIDKNGLTKSIAKAMRLALSQIKTEFSEVVIDGNYNYLPDISASRTFIKADLLVPEVSAASIVAKVARDEYMAKQAKIYPLYGFDKHVGYGTKLHLEAIIKHGICDLHRRSFKPVSVYA